MPVPVVRSEIRARMTHRSGLASQLLALLQQQGIQVDYKWVDQYLVPLAWKMSAPEGFPPYPRRGDTYSEAEAIQLSIWVSNEWPILKEMAFRIQDTADWLNTRGLGEKAAKILDIHSSGEIWQSLQSEWQSWKRYDLYRDGKSVSLSAAGKTPKQFIADLTEWAKERFAPFMRGLSLMKDASLYEELHTPEEVNAQIAKWYQIQHSGIATNNLQEHALWRLYNISRNWDKLPDEHGREYPVVQLIAWGKVTPWDGIQRLRKKRREETEQTNLRVEAYEGAYKVLLSALARAPVGVAWNAVELKRYLPVGYEYAPQQGKPEIIIGLPSKGYTFRPRPFIIAGRRGVRQYIDPSTKAEAWAGLTQTVDNFRQTGELPR